MAHDHFVAQTYLKHFVGKDRMLHAYEPDFTLPPRGSVRWGTIPLHGVERVNRAVAQCAEDLVISSSKLPTVEALVAACARHRVDVEFIDLRLKPDEFIFGNRTRVREQPLGAPPVSPGI
jgi:hypothetical protein